MLTGVLHSAIRMSHQAVTGLGAHPRGHGGEPAQHLTGLRCTALYPASAELMQRPDLQTPHVLLMAYLDGGDTVFALVVEDLKR